ncbi:TPA: hypothetical protein ACG808_000090 [Enterococcus faecium]
MSASRLRIILMRMTFGIVPIVASAQRDVSSEISLRSRKETKNMNQQKKNLEITGRLICPLSVGTAAFIAENGGIRRTSNVLRMERISPDEIRFETCNTNYRLHLIRQEVTA